MPKSHPKEVMDYAGSGSELQLSWRNSGVAPIYLPCSTAVALFDDVSKLVASARLDDSHPGK